MVGCALGSVVDIPVSIAAFAMTAIFICLLVTQRFTSANIVAMVVAMVGVFVCKSLGLSGLAILVGAVAGVACAMVFSLVRGKGAAEASLAGDAADAAEGGLSEVAGAPKEEGLSEDAGAPKEDGR